MYGLRVARPWAIKRSVFECNRKTPNFFKRRCTHVAARVFVCMCKRVHTCSRVCTCLHYISVCRGKRCACICYVRFCATSQPIAFAELILLLCMLAATSIRIEFQSFFANSFRTIHQMIKIHAQKKSVSLNLAPHLT